MQEPTQDEKRKGGVTAGGWDNSMKVVEVVEVKGWARWGFEKV